jgi:hypothetical protein
MMIRSSVVAAALLTLTIGIGTAWAEDAAPPAGPPAASAKMSPEEKKAIAKSCIDQANAKGLHGKERKKFKKACKHHGGKAPE